MKPLKIGLAQPDPIVLQLTDSIVEGATGDATLTNSPVTLVVLGTLRTAGADAITEEVQAKENWLAKRSARRDAMREVRVAVKRYATYAYSVFAGNATKLNGLGLDVVELSGQIGVLSAPANVRSKAGKVAGTIRVLWRSVRGGKVYVLECMEVGGTQWTVAYQGPRTSFTCGGLVPGKEYVFRVHALGTAGAGAMSDISQERAR
jgi:muconolactone delta-isomerase